ncbi:MAG: DUF3137 domain-containing protein [Pseudomonadota bacterium]
MGIVNWLLEPIREVRDLAPAEVQTATRSLRLTGAQTIKDGTFESLEQQRLAAKQHRSRVLVLGIPSALMLGLLVYLLNLWMETDSTDSVLWGVIAAVVGGLLVHLIADVGFWLFRKTAKHSVLSALAVQQGLQYQMESVPGDIMDAFEGQNLFGSSTNGGKSEDLFMGKISDVDFMLFEAERESISRSKESTTTKLIFHGLCMRLSFPKRFSGTTRVMSDKGMLNKLHTTGNDLPLERVKLEDAAFEKQFEVLSTDQVEARYLLTPALMERLVEVQKILGPKTRLRAGFFDRHMLLTLDTRKNRPLSKRVGVSLNKLHHFEIPDVSKPVEESGLTKQFDKEIAVCRAIVDTLKLNMKTRV